MFDNDDLRSFQWMTGPVSYRSNFREFGALLGYAYAGAEIKSGTRMHVAGVDPKSPPVRISPSGRVPEQGCRSPILDFRGDGASLYVSWKITLSFELFRVKGIK